MNKKYFIKIINEEIKKFDFLGNDSFLKEQEIIDLLQNEDLQKQFICDSLLNKKNKIKITKIVDSYIDGNWNEVNYEDANRLSLEYSINIEYLYDSQKEPLKFNLNFNADKINIGIDGSYNKGNYETEPSEDIWYNYFNWDDINVTLFTMDGDDIIFTAFNNAPPKIQVLFIREYTQNFIETHTLNIRTQEMKNNVQNTPYC